MMPPRHIIGPRRAAPPPPVSSKGSFSANTWSPARTVPSRVEDADHPDRETRPRFTALDIRCAPSRDHHDHSYAMASSPLSDYYQSPSTIATHKSLQAPTDDTESYTTASWASMAGDPTQVVLVIEREQGSPSKSRNCRLPGTFSRQSSRGASPSPSTCLSIRSAASGGPPGEGVSSTLSAPRMPFARCPSPAASVSTVATILAPTSTQAASEDLARNAPDTAQNASTASQLMLRARKRQSSQRRLDSLKNLFTDLNLQNPWEQDVDVSSSEDFSDGSMNGQFSSSSSLLDHEPERAPTPARCHPSNHRRRAVAIYGAEDIKRQEVIWEMEDTERSFLESLTLINRLFVRPLKSHGGAWMAGIPPRIGQILDQVEVLTILHTDILEAFARLRQTTSYVDLDDFADTFDKLIPRLDAYEYYLVNFSRAAADVDETSRDQHSFLGEFFRMQAKKPEMGSLGLSSLLLKPVQRLMRYPLFLQRLIELVDSDEDTYSLLSSVLERLQLTIHRLQDAKSSFDDQEDVEQLESQLFGLPAGFRLAVPGRKLIGCGYVSRLPKRALGIDTMARTSSLASSQSSIFSSSRSSVVSNDTFWTTQESTTRSSTFSQWSMSSGALSRSGSVQTRSGESSCPSMTRSSSATSSIRSFNFSRGGSLSPRKSKKNDPVMLFIFNDLLVAAQPTDKPGLFGKGRKTAGWQVLPTAEGGLGRLLDYQDWSGWHGHAHLFTATVLPVHSEAGEELAPVTTCYALPGPSPERSREMKCPTIHDTQGFLQALAQTVPATFTSGSFDEKEEEDIIRPGLELVF